MFLPNEASSSLPVPFLTAGRDSELNDSIFGQVSHCWLKLRMHFHAIQLQFLYRSSKSREELAQQPDQHHRVVSPTAATVPRWWSGELKYDIFFFSNFNCLTKALILRHLYRLERPYNCASLFTSKTLLNTKTGLTPQDALASIIALAVISLFESTLFSVNSLKLQCCKNQSVPGLQMHLAPTSSCTFTSTIAKFSDWTVSAATLFLSTYMNFVCAEKEPFTPM